MQSAKDRGTLDALRFGSLALSPLLLLTGLWFYSYANAVDIAFLESTFLIIVFSFFISSEAAMNKLNIHFYCAGALFTSTLFIYFLYANYVDLMGTISIGGIIVYGAPTVLIYILCTKQKADSW